MGAEFAIRANGPFARTEFAFAPFAFADPFARIKPSQFSINARGTQITSVWAIIKLGRVLVIT